MATIGDIKLIASIDTGNYTRGAKEIDSANKQMEQSSNSAGKSSDGLNSKLLRFAGAGLKTAAVGMAGLATAVATLSIGGGISRALNIEDAQAKLKGLGHDANSVKTIMNSALDSVRGTAYGLDAAATIAAGAVAAGIKPGQALTKYLKLTADAATIAGSSLSEMGSVLNRVQTSQVAYTEDLNMLADRGIPIFQWLQEEYGVTATALKKMVSDGKVDAETYFRVIEKNIGGAALQSGATTRGAWANMLAALSRVGEAIVKGPIDQIRTGFGTLTKWIDANANNIVSSVQSVMAFFVRVGKSAIDLGKQVGNYLAPAFNDLRSVISGSVIPALDRMFTTVRPLIPIIGNVLVGAVNAAINVLTTVLRIASTLGPAILGLTAGFLAYRTAVVAVTIAQSAQAIGAALLGTRYVMVNGVIIATTIAQRALNAAMMANPIGLVVGALAFLGATLFAAATQTDKNKSATDRLNTARAAAKTAADNLRAAEDALSGAQLSAEGSTLAVERAQRTYNDTVAQYGPRSLEAREASFGLKQAQDNLARSNQDVATKQQEVTNKQNENVAATGALEKANGSKRSSFLQLRDSMEANTASTGGLITALDRLNGKTVTYNVRGSVDNAEAAKAAGYSSGAPFVQRYSGGPVSAGRAYMVGENRDGSINDTTELFVPNQSGRIINSKDLQSALGSGSGGGTEINIANVNISNEVDGERWLRRLSGNQEDVSHGLVPVQTYM